MTLPSVIGNYRKKITVSRLQEAYSLLSQAVLMSIKDNEAIEYWDFTISGEEFLQRYIKPYMQDIVNIDGDGKEGSLNSDSKTMALANGQTIYGTIYKNSLVLPYFNIIVDINGNKKPNLMGVDRFSFYIFSKKAILSNTGLGDCAQNIPRGGLYPDGYGYSRERLLNDGWRGCNNDKNALAPDGGRRTSQFGAFCTALIMMDGWKISDDYKW